jgi:hypothetical protein
MTDSKRQIVYAVAYEDVTRATGTCPPSTAATVSLAK